MDFETQFDAEASDVQVDMNDWIMDGDLGELMHSSLQMSSPMTQPPMLSYSGENVFDYFDSFPPLLSPDDPWITGHSGFVWQDFVEEQYLPTMPPHPEEQQTLVTSGIYDLTLPGWDWDSDNLVAALDIQPPQVEHRSRRSYRPRNHGPQKCEHCNIAFRRPRDLHRHMRRHDRPLKCAQCPASLAEQRDLDRHYLTNHRGYAQRELGLRPQAPSWCDICIQPFTRRDNFLKHMRKYHGGDHGAQVCSE